MQNTFKSSSSSSSFSSSDMERNRSLDNSSDPNKRIHRPGWDDPAHAQLRTPPPLAAATPPAREECGTALPSSPPSLASFPSVENPPPICVNPCSSVVENPSPLP